MARLLSLIALGSQSKGRRIRLENGECLRRGIFEFLGNTRATHTRVVSSSVCRVGRLLRGHQKVPGGFSESRKLDSPKSGPALFDAQSPPKEESTSNRLKIPFYVPLHGAHKLFSAHKISGPISKFMQRVRSTFGNL